MSCETRIVLHAQTTNGPQNNASYRIRVRNSAQAKAALTRTYTLRPGDLLGTSLRSGR